jgi:RNA polymerase sigma factor (sigma-70 family)
MARFDKAQGKTLDPDAPEGGLTARLRRVLARWAGAPSTGKPLSVEERHELVRALYDEHEPFVYGLLCALRTRDIAPESANDMVLEVFETLDHEIHGGPPEDARALLARIAKNAILNRRRVGRRREARLDREASGDEVPASQPGAEERVHLADCERIVEEILARMPEAAAELIRLIDIQLMSHEEVAAIVNRKVDTVTKQHSRAKALFAKLLMELYGLELGGAL